MFECDLRSSHVVQNDVGDALHLIVARYGHDRHRQRKCPRGIDGDQTINGSFQKKSGIFIDQVGAMAVANHKVKVSLLQKMVFHAAHDRGRVAIADFRDNNSDGKAALRAQRTRKKVGAVFVLRDCGKDSVFGFLRE